MDKYLKKIPGECAVIGLGCGFNGLDGIKFPLAENDKEHTKICEMQVLVLIRILFVIFHKIRAVITKQNISIFSNSNK